VKSLLPKKISHEKKLKLFEKYKNLVYYISHKFPFKNQLTFQELSCAGMLGLLHAIEHFDEKKEKTFPIYAYKWILQFIKRELRNLSSVKIPQMLLRYYDDIREVEREFFYENRRLPSAREIVEQLVIRYPQLKDKGKYISKLEHTIQEMQIGLVTLDEERLATVLEKPQQDESYKSYYNLYHQYLGEMIRKGLELLEDRKRKIIKLHFGLENNVQWNLASIGRYLHLSRERVRQLLNAGLKQLKNIISKKNLEFQIRIK
ncbi:MAG: sigma-70 family RNA polymerase sigma factor, partial [Planctomycetota bacterium]